MTHVSFAEHDAQLELFLEGRLDEYKGKLNQPKHLSLIERLMGNHGEYDPDWAAKFVKKQGSEMRLVSMSESPERATAEDTEEAAA